MLEKESLEKIITYLLRGNILEDQRKYVTGGRVFCGAPNALTCHINNDARTRNMQSYEQRDWETDINRKLKRKQKM